MALTKCNVPGDVIGSLATRAEERLLSTQAFKDKFDEMPEGIKQYINEVLTEEIDAHIADYLAHKADNATDAHNGTTIQDSDLIVTVGAGGDYATLNEALIALSRKYPEYKKGGYAVTVNLLSGYVETEGINVAGIDLGWVKITSEDTEVSANVSGNLIDVNNNGVGPIISTVFNMGGNGGKGIRCFNNASIMVGGACGVKNAGTDCISSERFSRIHAVYAIATGAGRYGVSAYMGSSVAINNGEASGTDADIRVREGGIIYARYATGTPSQATNTITVNGIIFQ